MNFHYKVGVIKYALLSVNIKKNITKRKKKYFLKHIIQRNIAKRSTFKQNLNSAHWLPLLSLQPIHNIHVQMWCISDLYWIIPVRFTFIHPSISYAVIRFSYICFCPCKLTYTLILQEIQGGWEKCWKIHNMPEHRATH